MSLSFWSNSLNDKYITLHEKNINPFTEIAEKLHKFDYVVGNLECLPMNSSGENLLKRPRLRTTLSTLNYLTKIGLNIACLAQNHIYDHLKMGVLQTTRFLEEKNILYLGASIKSGEEAKPLIIRNAEESVALLNYVSNDTNPCLPTDSGVFVNIFNIANAITTIQETKQVVSFVIVILHWGGRVEGGLYPDWDQPNIARKLIDAGADLIIGHHSHTVQPYEIYKHKYIYYSLGNFCFSDYWFEGNLNPMSNRRKVCFIPGITINRGKISVEHYYWQNNLTSFKILPFYKSKHKVRNLIFKFLRRFHLLWFIYFFIFKKIMPTILFFSRTDLTLIQKTKRYFIAIKKRVTK